MEYRVAISEQSSSCYNCEGKSVPLGFDYCDTCQYTYCGLVERREYADQTVGYYASEKEADEALASLVPFTSSTPL